MSIKRVIINNPLVEKQHSWREQGSFGSADEVKIPLEFSGRRLDHRPLDDSLVPDLGWV